MKKVFTTCVSFLLCVCAFPQLTDNFNDGDFTASPAWVGAGTDWIVNPSLQLQSNNTVANSTYYISTANTLATNAQWELNVTLTFNTSSNNFVDVFLTASQSNLVSTATSGYFVRIGGVDDEISLFKQDALGVETKIIDGINGITNSANNVLKIKVIRSTGNQWTLFRDVTGTGNTYVAEGTVADGTFTTSSFFGILVEQSTATFFQKHFFDNIEVKPYVPDFTPPAIQTVSATSANTVDVLFNEPVDLPTAQTLTNYSVNNSVGNPTQALRDVTNIALVHLTFVANFPNGTTNTLTAINIKDIAGNAMTSGTGTFSFYIPQRYDVVIDEILADPTPQVALPNAEFVEIKNTTTQSINLQGWKISSTATTSSAFPSYILPADSFLVLTSTTNAPSFTGYGRVLGVTSFPALDNTSTTLSLISKEGITIHAVNYNVAWYNNAVKSDGGWTLEMIDTKNPCSGASNWKASTDARGGTPAAKNSVDGNNKDQTAPALLKAAAIDSVTVVLTFDEPLDSLKGATTANYAISDGVTIASVFAVGPTFNKVQLRLSTPLVRNKIYTVTASNVTDCSGNVIQALRTARLGLTSTIDSFDIVINELLFNPKSSGVDYVEIYNRSNKIFDLKDLFIANRSSSTNVIGSVKQLTTDNILLFPNDFYVISENGAIVKQQYVAKNPDNFVDVSTMPSYPDDKGFVVLLNAQGRIVDELDYDTKWHFDLLDNEEGISLERIDYSKPTNSKDNWFSAASTVGYGTPSYQNSQFRADLQVQGDVVVTPKVFSPDNDGTDDFALINYKMTELGYVANITIYDAAGRPVKALAKNATLAAAGSFRWDGLDDKLRKVAVGAYVIYTEVFNLNGKKKSFKNTVVVAARF